MSDESEYRCFIGGLAWATTDRDLKYAFQRFSHLIEAKVEQVTREENTIVAYDLLEIYYELIVARFPVIQSQNIVGKANLEKADLEPALKALIDRLMTKNVAEDIATKLCESIAASLEGKKLASFTRVSSTVQSVMEKALLRILTPKRSIDILRDVHAAKEQRGQYVVVFVGVNGVGKSTDLAKVAYWLLQHDIKVMMAACDTFCSGAIEQLRTHARRLQIPIFEKGYEKYPAVVAKEAILEASRNGSDVVLVDTAGRMQTGGGTLPITARTLETMIRLSTAHVKLM